MISTLLWFAILSSGSVLCAAVWKRKYEEVLPITCSAIVIVLFLCGIAGSLLAGAVMVCVLGLAAYVAAVWWLLRKKEWIAFIHNIFTQGFLGFVIIFLCACYFNYGKVAGSWDEFSHWADITKVMATLNDFGTNPQSQSLYQSYPPGMSLFQYFLQKLCQWSEHVPFSEWRLYVAYQILAFVFMLPFLKNLKAKNPFSLAVSLIVLFLCPMLFYQDFYEIIYIDSFLGVLSGTGLATIFLCKERDVFYSLRIAVTIVMLVLAKDAGLLLAGFLALAYVLDYVHESKAANGKMSGKFQYKRWICIPVALLAAGLPKLLWKYHLTVSNAKLSFSQPYDIDKLVKILLRQDIGWQRIVLVDYFKKLIEARVSIGNTNIYLNYYSILFLLMGMLAVLGIFFEKKDKTYRWKNRMLLGCVALQFAVYIIGLCLTYIFRFTEYEATRFASFERYINIVYLAVWLMAIMILLGGVVNQNSKSSLAAEILLLAVIVTISPLESVFDYIRGGYVNDSLATKAKYQPLINAIADIPEESAHVYYISQESEGYDYWLMRYNARPHIFNVGGNSIGEAFYEGDIWTREITAEQWQEELVASYDYVALYWINDFFLQHFSQLFEAEEDICNESLYKVNKETGLLERVEYEDYNYHSGL